MTELEAISEPALAQRLSSTAEEVADGTWHLDRDWLSRKGWYAIPTEKGHHFEEADAERIASVLREGGNLECYAVSTELTAQQPDCYRLPATRLGLMTFSSECAGLNYLLLPANQIALILCTSEDYNITAGPRPLVERILGMDIPAAGARFLEYTSDDWWEGCMLEVAKRYEVLPR